MTNEVKNVPELRFPEFSGEWKEKELGQCTNLITKGTTPKDKSGKGTINYIKVENIYNAKIKPRMKININEHEGYLKRSKLEANDILFSIAGTLGRTAVVNKSHLPANTNQALAIIRGYDFETDFLITTLGGHAVAKYIRKNPTVGAQPNLSLNQVSKLIINTPSKNEQKKIGVFFSKLDRQIELEEQKLEKLEEQKKGYMQKIFSQELRFKDENGNDYPNWIFEELNNIFTKYQNTIYLHDNEEYKRISISNKGKITHRDITFGKRIGRKRQYLIDLKKHPNTLTFIRQGVFLGGIGFIPSSLDGYIVTENMPLLSMSEEYSKKFMTYLFSSESYYKSVIFKNLPTGSAQKALHEKDWLKSFVNIPVYSEQEKIGNFFEKQDNLIKKQSDKVELLKERKKGFLQKMFV
ncbi:restriction endonuclease subunit S [Staphylococcus cohnii]